MEKPLLDFVMDCFAESDETYQEISDGSGVPRRTVEKVARGETSDPTVSTVQALADYFRKKGATGAPAAARIGARS